MKIKFNTIYLKNFRRGLATNSSSTHSVIYKKEGEVFKDLDVFENDYFGRCDRTIAATREAKIKYILHYIFYNSDLVDILSGFYPEMKKYYPKIAKSLKKEDDDSFGGHFRGSFTDNDLEFNVKYIRNIIENPDIVIVGGSDETDFVYETCDGHSEEPLPDDARYDSDYPDTKSGIVKNGNYYVAYGHTNEYEDENTGEVYPKYKNSTNGRLRFSTTPDAPIPEYPELIDLRITNRCNNGCPFCFMDSKATEPDADAGFIVRLMNDINDTRVEFSIGGGNILLHPELERILSSINNKGHIVNVTINAKNITDVIDNPKMYEIFKNYVDGIGVSIVDDADLQEFIRFTKSFNNSKDYEYERVHKKYIVAHLIPEMLGVGLTRSIIDRLRKEQIYCGILFLGYKTNGRGKSYGVKAFSNDELNTLMASVEHTWGISIDTTFANRYLDYIKKNFSWRKSITLNEGEYSMYIDGVTKCAYKSSYQTDIPYKMSYDEEEWKKYYEDVKNGKDVERPKRYNLREAFAKIRTDGGFEAYDRDKRTQQYYDEQKQTGKKSSGQASRKTKG